jgi:hypothetical protein
MAPPGTPLTDLEKEAQQRLKDCQAQKAFVQTDLQEGYFFTAPQRARDMGSSTAGVASDTRPDDASTLATSIGIEVAQDFATEMVNTFMPSVIAWASQRAAVEIPPDEAERVKDQIDENTETVMEAIKTSNLYDAVAVGFKPDLSLGTVAMWVGDGPITGSTLCLPVPLRELEINVGPHGDIDDRFIIRSTRNRYVRALIGKDAKLSAEIEKGIKDKPNGKVKVSWAWWRLWDRTDDVVWRWVVRVGDRIVNDGTLEGDGSCPLIVSRFNVDPNFPFGTGPTIQCLPELRELDETRILKAENRDFQIHPAFVYQDDGVMNFSNGIEPGMGYVARSWGNGKPVEKLSFEGNLEVAEYEVAQMEHRIRRLHFVDFPEQVGKTPPTAEQWAEELMRAKRRIGTPGRVFWKEGPAEYFKRFKWRLEKAGVLEPLTAGNRPLPLVPYDPTEQAQEHQEVAIAGRILEMARNYFPQTAPVEIDGSATLANLKTKLRDKIVVLRSPDDIKAAITNLAPVLGGGVGGGPATPPQGGFPA